MTKQKRTASKIVASTTAHTAANPREEFFDPVLPVINAHRKRVEILSEAVRVEGAFHGNLKSAAYARLEKATSELGTI